MAGNTDPDVQVEPFDEGDRSGVRVRVEDYVVEVARHEGSPGPGMDGWNERLDGPRPRTRVAKIIMPLEGTPLDQAGQLIAKITSDMSAAGYFVYIRMLPPGEGVALHRHQVYDTVVSVLDGEIEIEMNDRLFKAGPGTLGNFPRGTPHGFHNVGSSPARLAIASAPGGLDKYFERIKGKTDRAEIARIGRQYGVETIGPDYIVNSIGMRLVKVWPGEFMMGSPNTDGNAHPDEKPQHRVRITKPFRIGMHQVTVGQFKKFVAATGYQTEGEVNGVGSFGLDLITGLVSPRPEYTWKKWLIEDSTHPSGFTQTDNHPIVCVSYFDALTFCNWLSAVEGRRYRLPTEAEWEYVCRAGSTTRYANGDDEEGVKWIGNIADASLPRRWIWNMDLNPPFPKGTPLPPYAKPWDDGYPFTAPAGSFKPNAWGLYDMHGNVGEWCSDWYSPKYYETSPVDDPKGPAAPEMIDLRDRNVPGLTERTLRVIRGAVWLDSAVDCRSADRQTHIRHPVDSAADIGLRVVLEA